MSAARPVCVLGVVRSGTSLTARVLNTLGLDLGPEDTMVPAGEINPRGFWEQLEVNKLNSDVLAALGGTAWRPPPRPPGWELADDMADLRARIAELVERYFGQSERWGLKGSSLTLPIWRAVVGELDYVVCVRNPLEVVASVDAVASAGEPLTQGHTELALWLHYTCEALRLTTGGRRIFVFYEEWIDRPERVVDRLGRFLHGVDWASGGADARRAFAEWDPSLRRQRASDVELAERAEVPFEGRAFHFLVRSLAEAERRGDEERAEALQVVAAALDRDALDGKWGAGLVEGR